MSTFALPVLSSDVGLSSYLARINALPYLEEEEEIELAKQWVESGSLDAAHKLVTSHLRLVAKIAMGFRGYGLPLVELISEGNIGLMQAVKKFDPSKGFRLATYAMWWIKASIQEYILHSWSLVKIGTTTAQKKLFFNLRRAKNRLKKFDDSSLLPNEVKAIAGELAVSEQDVIDMDLRLNNSDQSLNDMITGIDGDSAEKIEFLADERDNQEVLLLQNNELEYKKSLMRQAFLTLNEREKEILTARMLKEVPSTLEELSIEHGISRERVRQIEARAMEKLKSCVSGG